MTASTPTRTTLHDGWTLEPAHPAARGVPDVVITAGSVPASVPGSVHTDLLGAGLIDDPYLDDNERLQAWIGQTDWTYRRQLTWTPDGSERQELVFDGLDTVAEVMLNDETVASTRNMHRSYRIDVTGRLREGVNALAVRFASAVRFADAASLELGYRPHVNQHPFNAIRKMACSFGWDWGPDTATAGIWRPVRLETWSGAHLAETRTAGDVVDGVPTARVDASLRRTAETAAELVVRIGGVEQSVAVAEGDERASIAVAVPDAALWWPTGHGAAALHDLEVELRLGGEVVDRLRRRIGFRSVEVRTEADDAGVGFAIVVNGDAVLVRGANWIPDDAFPHRIDRTRYAHRLQQAEFARINLLRVWGGGIYEAEDFYAECDERGILVWQDFLLACAAYAEEEPLRSEIEAEAREAVVRLGAHPSLVVLNGNNENVWGHQDWGWQKRLDGRTWGASYYYDLFPAIVAELAPHVAYTPGSPFSPDRDAYQNEPSTGTMHIWDLWNAKDYPHYRDYRPRFVAEFGWQGPATWATTTRAVSDVPLTPESPGMLVHQKAESGNVKLTDGLLAHFPLPDVVEDWHWAMSLNQANAVRTGIEWFRSLTPYCTGSIVWQLNDCWPVTSWAAVDGDGRPKPLLHALRHAHSEQLLTVQPAENGGLLVAAVNDTAGALTGDLVVERRAFDGEVIASFTTALSVDPRSARTVTLEETLTCADEAGSEVLVARLGGSTAYWFFAEYRDSALTDPGLRATATPTDHGWLVEVTTERLARDVTLLVDRVHPDAVADDALLTLLPGESARISITGARDADPARFAEPDVLRSANDLLRPQRA